MFRTCQAILRVLANAGRLKRRSFVAGSWINVDFTVRHRPDPTENERAIQKHFLSRTRVSRPTAKLRLNYAGSGQQSIQK
jgi:hypothetical protein